MKISARNQIKGTIKKVELGAVMAKVAVEIAGGTMVNSIITIDSVNELNLKEGDEVTAIVKSTEIMIGK